MEDLLAALMRRSLVLVELRVVVHGLGPGLGLGARCRFGWRTGHGPGRRRIALGAVVMALPSAPALQSMGIGTEAAAAAAGSAAGRSCATAAEAPTAKATRDVKGRGTHDKTPDVRNDTERKHERGMPTLTAPLRARGERAGRDADQIRVASGGVKARGALERDARRGPAGHGRQVDHQATHCGIGLAGYQRVGDRQRETQRSQAITDHLQLRSTERASRRSPGS